MLEKIICVGTTTQNNKLVNGQSMMFQLFVDQLVLNDIEPKIVDFGISIDKNFSAKRVSGEFSFTKLIDNFLLTIRYVFTLLKNPHTPIYINTSQSKVGFIRDYIFINLGKMFKRKIIGHQFGANYQNFYNMQSPRLKQMIKKTLQKTDKFIVEGDFTKAQLKFVSNFETKVISIPNGLPQKIDEQKISPKTIQPSEPITLFYLSNMIESKGFWDVLEAANILQNKLSVKLKLVFAGKFLGDVEDTICKNPKEAHEVFQSKLTQYQLSDVTEYYGGLFNQEKSTAFLNAHFFLLPSYYINEGQPVSVLEALAYGCVPIVTNYRLIPSMVNENNGFFVNPKSPQEIAEIINNCLKDPDLYHKKSKASINFYLENFTAEKYVLHILNQFKSES